MTWSDIRETKHRGAKGDPMMTQCELVEQHTGQVDVRWIPQQFAKRLKVLQIRTREGRWMVTNVYGSKPMSYLEKHERDFKHQRDASDILKGGAYNLGLVEGLQREENS